MPSVLVGDNLESIIVFGHKNRATISPLANDGLCYTILLFNPYMSNVFSLPNKLGESISNFKINFCDNSGEPDQTPRFAASDLVLHCLLMSHKKDTRLIWGKVLYIVGLLHILNGFDLIHSESATMKQNYTARRTTSEHQI